ncbi:MAG: hypothetical protein NTZ08_02320 [Verrucomicrobia bacterium]|nr:hypothetical protein [Verrucomicrobiota bacterium]
MPNPLPQLHQRLRALVCAIVGVFLIIISLVIILTQFTELSAKNENLSLASFLVILSFSGVAFQWSTVTSGFASPKVLKKIYQTGVDLFLDSLLALIAAFFAWLQSTPGMLAPWLGTVCLVIHWLFLSLAVIFFLISTLCLLLAIKEVERDTK